jgi:seryl-tRNA synthetase
LKTKTATLKAETAALKAETAALKAETAALKAENARLTAALLDAQTIPDDDLERDESQLVNEGADHLSQDEASGEPESDAAAAAAAAAAADEHAFRFPYDRSAVFEFRHGRLCRVDRVSVHPSIHPS